MGYIKHHAIVITSFDSALIDNCAREANRIGVEFLGPSAEAINGYRTMTVLPDGSKEAWDDSDRGDERRAQLKEWLNGQRYEDDSTSLHWVEVSYSGDDSAAVIEAHAWQQHCSIPTAP